MVKQWYFSQFTLDISVSKTNLQGTKEEIWSTCLTISYPDLHKRSVTNLSEGQLTNTYLKIEDDFFISPHIKFLFGLLKLFTIFLHFPLYIITYTNLSSTF